MKDYDEMEGASGCLIVVMVIFCVASIVYLIGDHIAEAIRCGVFATFIGLALSLMARLRRSHERKM